MPSALAEIVQRPDLDLYPEQRRVATLEDALDTMRDRDLRIAPVAGKTIVDTFQVTFAYEDPAKAQSVVRTISERFNDGSVQVVTPANLPDHAEQGNRWIHVASGTAAGMALGLLLAWLRRRDLRWTLEVLDCGLTGAAIAFAVYLLIPEMFARAQTAYEWIGLLSAAGLVSGAWIWRDRSRSAMRTVAFWAASCAIVAGLVSFTAEERFVSHAELRFNPRSEPAPRQPVTPAFLFALVREEMLSRSSLMGLIQRPSLDLYREERARQPMENIVTAMRERDLKIEAITPVDFQDVFPPGRFRVSFEYRDAQKAQEVVRGVVTDLTGGNANLTRFLRPDYGPWTALEVASPASLSDEPVSPNRWSYAVTGLAAGAILGALLSQGPVLIARSRSARYAGAVATLGMAAAGVASFMIPDRYVSTALIEVSAGPGQDVAARARELVREVLTDDSISAVWNRAQTDRRLGDQPGPSKEALQGMRDRSLLLKVTDGAPAGPGVVHIHISFNCPGREQAQMGMQQIVTNMMEGHIEGSASNLRLRNQAVWRAPTGTVEIRALRVTDLPSLPQSPSSPNRPAISVAGGAGGLILGLVLARVCKPKK
ncbi:MAG: hypothetical protein ABI759_30420 [Candidatus Solibacter sp.]